jgi:hypothetical protein
MFWLWDYVNDMRKNRTFEMTGNCQYPAHLENKIFMNLQQKHFNCGKNKNNNSINGCSLKLSPFFLRIFTVCLKFSSSNKNSIQFLFLFLYTKNFQEGKGKLWIIFNVLIYDPKLYFSPFIKLKLN